MPPLYTMAHHFTDHGYATAAFGKMHFVPDTEPSCGRERHFGFGERVDYEEFWTYLRQERGYPPVPGIADNPEKIVHLEKWQHVLQSYGVALPDETRPSRQHVMPAGAMGTLCHEDHQEALVLRAWEGFLSQERDAPFLAFVSFQSPHPPFVPPAQFLSHYEEDLPLPALPDTAMRHHPVWGPSMRSATDEQRMRYLRYYSAFVTYMDWCAGEALRLLEEAGQAHNTLVIYVSDHGDMGFQHGLTGKSVFYEESVRVPLIMRFPDRTPVGWSHRGLVELIDVFPTICDASGIALPSNLPGRSLWADLIHRSDEGKEAVLSESYPMVRNRDVFGLRPHRMILTDTWKLIQYGDVCVDLFSVLRDPGNHTNLSRDPEHEGVIKQLLSTLDAKLGPLPQSEWM